MVALWVLLLDQSIDLLPIGTLVDLYAYQVGEVAGLAQYRYFFSKKAVLAIENVPKPDIISISENMYTEPDNKKTTPPQKKTRKTRVKN